MFGKVIKRIVLAVFALLTAAGVTFTVFGAVATVREFERVSSQPGASGVDYLAAHLLRGETVFFAGVTFILLMITLILLGWVLSEKDREPDRPDPPTAGKEPDEGSDAAPPA